MNLAEGTTRFLLDPRDHIRAMREARERQMDVIGFYHSHPRSRAYPSETDVAESGYAGALHLIAGEGEGRREMRLFVIDGAAWRNFGSGWRKMTTRVTYVAAGLRTRPEQSGLDRRSGLKTRRYSSPSGPLPTPGCTCSVVVPDPRMWSLALR